jgi:transketolase
VERQGWEARLAALSGAKQREFNRVMAGDVPAKLPAAIKALKRQLVETQPNIATRKASENTLEIINALMPEHVGGSADLTGSNNTKTGDQAVHLPANRDGRYLHYGIREHGMAAAMNGMSLHGGIRPYGGTFMCFADYARGAMRLSALMKQPVTYVMSHDSIGLGEDGPTHQPIEHLAMLRATPNMNVIRPADATETAEAWEIAVQSKTTPTVLALSRQNLPALRTEFKAKNMVAHGGYVMADAEGKREAILMATGSEVAIAMAARDLLHADGIGTRVVSLPCWELFEDQPDAYRRKVLPAGPVRVAVEAAIRFGWDRWLFGERGRREKSGFVGMHDFGASAPAEVLYEQFGITPQAVADKAKALLGRA